MNSILEIILPRQANNDYRGGRVPLWVAVVALALSLGLVTLVVLRYWL